MYESGNAYEQLKEEESESRTWSRSDFKQLPHPDTFRAGTPESTRIFPPEPKSTIDTYSRNHYPSEDPFFKETVDGENPSQKQEVSVEEHLAEHANCLQRLSLWFCCVRSGDHGCCDYWHLFAAFLALFAGGYWVFRCVTSAMDADYQDAAEFGVTALISFLCTIYAINQFNNMLSLLLADFGKKLQELKRTERLLDQTRQRFDNLHEKFQITTEDLMSTQTELERNVNSLVDTKSELQGTQEQLDLNRKQYEVTVNRLESIIKEHAQQHEELASEYDSLNLEHAALNKKYQENIMEQQELINETLMTAMSLQKRGSDEVKILLTKMAEVTNENQDAAREFGRSFVEAHKLKEELERVQKKLEETSESIQESAISLKETADKNIEMSERMEKMIAGISERRGSLDDTKKQRDDAFSGLLNRMLSEMNRNLVEWEGARHRHRTVSSITMRDLRSNSVPMQNLRDRLESSARPSLEDASLNNKTLIHRSLPQEPRR